MSFFEKITSFFSSSYINDIRFKHSTLSLLKIFFERGNKLKSALANLGNVFRNSKWVDLSVQNIKVSFVKSASLLYIALFASFIFVTCFYDLRVTFAVSEFITHYVPFGTEIIVVLFDFIAMFSDVADRATLFIYTLVFSALALIDKLSSPLQLGSKTKESSTQLTKPQSALGWLGSQKNTTGAGHKKYVTKLAKQSRSQLSPYAANPKWVGEASTLRSLYQSQKQLLSVNNSSSLVGSDKLVTSTFTTNVAISAATKGTDSLGWSPATLTKLDAHYVSNTTNSSGWTNSRPFSWDLPAKNFSLDTNLNFLAAVTEQAPDLAVTTLGLTDSLNLAKQDRWLMKNSLLANKLDRQNAAYSQMKSLVGSNFNMSQLTSSNVWVSSKAAQLDPSAASSFLSGTNNLLYPNLNPASLPDSTKALLGNSPALVNIDFFESSRTWLVKKYFFTSNLASNTYYHTDAATVHFTPASSKANTYSLMVEVVQGGLNNQLSDLSPSLTAASQHTLSDQGALPASSLTSSPSDLDLLKSTNLFFVSQLFSSASATGSVVFYSHINNTAVDAPAVVFKLR